MSKNGGALRLKNVWPENRRLFSGHTAGCSPFFAAVIFIGVKNGQADLMRILPMTSA